QSLQNFAKYLLNDEFHALSLPSNSDRGIDLGYLIHKRIGFTPMIQSYINFKLPAPSYKFSRDVLRLDLFDQNQPKAIFLLVHIKSKLDLKKADFEGRSRRKLEVEGLIKIYLELQKLGVPILVGGDFN